jgi:hypothetical protein
MVFTRSALAKQTANVKMATVVAPCDEEDNESNFDYEENARIVMNKRRQMLEIEEIKLHQLEKKTFIETQIIANNIAIQMQHHKERQAGLDCISNFVALLKSLDDNTTLDYHTRHALKLAATKQFLASR